MKTRVFRPIGAGAALGMVIAGAFGQRHAAARLAFAMILLGFTSLGAPEALRRCVGRLTARRQVRANAWMAAWLTSVGAAILLLAAPWLTEHYHFIERVFPVYEWTLCELRWWIYAAAGLALVRILTAAFDAAGDRLSVALTEALSCLAVGGSLLMCSGTSSAPQVCGVTAAALAALVGLIGLLLGRRISEPPVPGRTFEMMRDVPLAMVRWLAYPLAFSAGFLLSEKAFADNALAALLPEGMSLPLLIGLLVMELLRSAHRRDARESAPFCVWIALGALAAAAAVCGYVWLLPESSAAVDFTVMKRWIALKLLMELLLAAACGLGLYAAPCRRTVLMAAAAVLAALLPIGLLVHLSVTTPAVRLASILALILTFAPVCCAIPDMQTLRRQRRAEAMRRKARGVGRNGGETGGNARGRRPLDPCQRN